MQDKRDDMVDYEYLRRLNDGAYQNRISGIETLEKCNDSIDRTVAICEHSEYIFTQLDEEFAEKTRLGKKDIPLLFLAVALQMLRWILLPNLDLVHSKISKDERLKSNEVKKGGIYKGKRSGSNYEKPEINKILKNNPEKYREEEEEYRKKIQGNGRYKYLSWIEILLHAVPYDAMDGSEHILIKKINLVGKTTFISPIGTRLCGKNHHVATLGHDPVLGWVFGTMNIASGMITFCDLQTYPVNACTQLDKWKQNVDYLHPSNLYEMINYCIDSFKEDSKRLPAAIARQAMHMKSDKYTKDGLPIPLLPPDKAQELINKGWNSNEAERLLKKITKNVGIIGMQYTLAELINLIIRSIYLVLNSGDDGVGFNSVKAEKILKISQIIAEGSNVAVVVATRNLSTLDIGGIVSMLHKIAFESETRSQIETEFMKSKFEDIVMGDYL